MNELSTLDCPHFGACSGCVLSNALTNPPIWESVKNYFSFPIDLEVGALHGWRTKAKLAIRGISSLPKIGLYRTGSHYVQTMAHCKSHHSSINQAVFLLKEAIQIEKISIYNETKGLLRYAQFFVDLRTNLVQLVLVVQKEESSIKRLINRLLKMGDWNSIWLNVQPLETNRILGDEWVHLHKEPYLCQKINQEPFFFHPASFAQAHWTLFEKLAAYVVEQVPNQANLIELYAGVGVMGMLAASKCKNVQLVENNPFSHQSFLAKVSFPNVFYHLENVNIAIPRLLDRDCILIDPPRKGISPPLLHALEKKEGRIIYVSCDFSSFMRDINHLQEKGWKLTEGKGFLLFPGTNHVEIVATLQR